MDEDRRGFHAAQKDAFVWALKCEAMQGGEPIAAPGWPLEVDGSWAAAAVLRGRAPQWRMSHPASQLCSTQPHFLPSAILSTQSTRKAQTPVLCNAQCAGVV